MQAAAVEITAALDYFLEICPSPEERRQRLYRGAIENGQLLATDFYTLRDWLAATGYQERTSLHALILLLFAALEEGSLCVELSEISLRRRLEEMADADDAAWWAAAILADLREQDFSRLIGPDANAGTPLVRWTQDGRDLLFFQKYLRHEEALVQALQSRIRRGLQFPHGIDGAALRAILREVLIEKPLHHDAQPLQLDADQRTALALALARPLTIFSGGPGTGKTSLIFTLLRCLVRCGIPVERMALAAPTGRAAQRLGDALRGGLARLASNASAADHALAALMPTTLHQLLSLQPSRGLFRRHRENTIPADVVIVDEVSMVSLPMMSGLLDAVDPEARLVLLGDKDQLPSVEAGAVLAHLVPHDGEPAYSAAFSQCAAELFASTSPASRSDARKKRSEQPLALFDAPPLEDTLALLRTNHRSEQRIQDAANAINQQDVGVLERLPRTLPAEMSAAARWQALAAEGGCHYLPVESGRTDELRYLLAGWARHAYLEASSERGAYPVLVAQCRLNDRDEYDAQTAATLADLLTLVDRARLLTLVREGPWGCVGINQFLERFLRPHFPRSEKAGLLPGAPVLITHTDHERRLFNGDVGLALTAEQGGIRVVFSRPDGFRSYPAESLPGHELGFALTVHKSQGSEYDQVMLVFPPEGAKRLLTRELVYTGITRARRLAVLLGKDEVIRRALASRVEREAGLLRRLQEG